LTVGVEDADVEVADEDQDAGSGVASTDAMWCSRLLCRRVITPASSMRSWRMRQWPVSIAVPVGTAFGRAL
jgi:hypothetical protein